jgi:alkanesulfonate monooxygenase SsuD/methylene tetrahydromethanopterin reductase-like flavin-dependent oxidoreductase (luciferase family)
MTTIALRYDLRIPPWAPTTHAEAYAACLEQCAWAEEKGTADIAVLNEHHGMEDGWMPAPFTMAAAVAARTSRLPISIAAAIVPMHDPVRLAEQIAVVDNIAKGRVSFVAGIGYARHEFEMAGVDPKRRAGLTEESIGVMRKAWTGEPFEWHGRTIRVTPTPFTKPHPMIMGGGASEPAARRAARLHLPFFPAINDPHLVAAYNDESEKAGNPNRFSILPKGPGFVHVTEDPDKAWSELGRFVLYDAESYRAMQSHGSRSGVVSHATDIDGIRKEGVYRIVTPEECAELAREIDPGGTIVLSPLLCGMPVDLGWESLELFRAKVLPVLRPS